MPALNRDLLRKLQFNFDRTALAARFGRDARTIGRWLRTGIVPRDIAALIPIYAGFMPWPAFREFAVVRDRIVIEGFHDGISADQLRAYPTILQERDSLRREVLRYRHAPAQYLLDV